MDFGFLSGINALGGGVLGYLIPFLFVLTVVVFFHELGHFLVARWCGVRVLVFSIGFGPELFGFNDRHNTRWKLCAIPLGGYVKFFGDDNAASVPDQAAIAAMRAEGGHCRGRSGGKFRIGYRYFRRSVHGLW
jgi:regulator of sigma E protease